MLMPSQIRGARAMLDWRPDELAHKAGISRADLDSVERGADAHFRTFSAIQKALEEAGVEFINESGPGVRLRQRGARDEGLHPSQLTSENDA